MENKMYAKHQFKCGFCGKIFDDLKDRVACEASCLMLHEEAEKKAAELKKKAEQEARHAEVTKLINDARVALNKYVDDYGVYDYEVEEDEDDIYSGMMAMLHHYLF